MPLVHRSVTITQEQDRFLRDMNKMGVAPSQGVRLALDKLMNDPPVVLSPRNTTRSGRVIAVRDEEPSS